MSSNRIITDWFEQYSDDIYHFLLYRTHSLDVEDLVQEVFIKAIKGYESYQEKASPKTWLLSIARNVAIDEYRKKTRLKWRNIIPFEEKHEPKLNQTPENIFQAKKEFKELYDAIQSLKPNYRDIIILRGMKELTVAETAQVLNWSENKVRSTYHRARKALLQKLGGISYES